MLLQPLEGGTRDLESYAKLNREAPIRSLTHRLLWGVPGNPCLAAKRDAATPRCKQASSVARQRRENAPAVVTWPCLLAFKVAVAARRDSNCLAESPSRLHVSTANAVTVRPAAGGYRTKIIKIKQSKTIVINFKCV